MRYRVLVEGLLLVFAFGAVGTPVSVVQAQEAGEQVNELYEGGEEQHWVDESDGNEPYDEGLDWFTTNKTPTYDNRIGALYFSDGLKSERTCTANYIGDYYWLTARHCVEDELNSIGFIQQSDGEFAGIELIEMAPDPEHDLALIRVGTGINARKFELSARPPRVGDGVRVIGYSGQVGQRNDFSSAADFRVGVVDYLVHTTRGDVYSDQVRLDPTGDANLCHGDSGAAVFAGNEIVGVASTTEIQNDSSGRKQCIGSGSAAKIDSNLGWIQKTVQNQSLTQAQKHRAWRGGVTAKFNRKSLGVHERSKLPGSSCGGSSCGK